MASLTFLTCFLTFTSCKARVISSLSSSTSNRTNDVTILRDSYKSVTAFDLTTPKEERVFRDRVWYPLDLVGPVTHGPTPKYVEDSVVRINGEVYNIEEAIGPLITKRDVSSSSSSQGRIGTGAELFLPIEDTGASNLDATDADTTPAPVVTGAIDYVLLPLIFLALSAPMFVVVYIVLASVEYKLPPNTQLREERSLNNRKHTYFDLQAATKPFFGFINEMMTARGGGDSDNNYHCKERMACEIGKWMGESVRDKMPSAYDYADAFLEMTIVPSTYSRIYKIYRASATKRVDDCSQFICFS